MWRTPARAPGHSVRVRGSREGWANDFTPFHEGIRCSLSSSSVGHARGIIYSLITRAEELLDYMLPIQAPDAAPRAIHMARPITRPNGTRTTSSSTTARPAAALQHVLRPMEAAAARRKCLVPAADQAWQGASPLQRRLAVATATTLRRPPHPLRRTGTAQHHLSPMRALSAKRLLSVA